MIGTKNILPSIFDKLLSETTQQKVEKLILYIAIASFLIHLLIIYVTKLNGSVFLQDSELFENPLVHAIAGFAICGRFPTSR